MLVVFFLVNSSLIAVKRAQPFERGVRVVPVWIPWVGIIATLSLLGFVWWNEVFAA